MNKKTRAVSKGEFEKLISTISEGFTLPTGENYKPNGRIAVALTLQANIGLRIGDVLHLRLADIVLETGRYHLDIVEQKTGKRRTFTVPTEVYIYLQNYALTKGIKPTQRLFDLSARAVQNHLQKACSYLGLEGIGTHSFRKFFAQTIYEKNNYDIALVRELLQHSSVAITQRYIGVSSQRVEQALQNHIYLPEQTS